MSVAILPACGGVPKVLPVTGESISEYPDTAWTRFAASSLGSRFILTGDLAGEYLVTRDSVVVRIPKPRIWHQPGPRAKRIAPRMLGTITLQLGKIGRRADSWTSASSSKPIEFRRRIDPNVETPLTPLRFAVPRPKGALSNYWLVFQLEDLTPGPQGQPRGFAYIHSDRNIFSSAK